MDFKIIVIKSLKLPQAIKGSSEELKKILS